ncbi:pyridoxamine 5'-phosphate oxidase family protein [Kitasatospora sp. HPMI-4]|uniref:pyridoxamine 5'-phosphate oxidase family protein n=1 Tax=Kitasatospora sp. HPMI-4 TaxID=3448443 RepID=UPI003F1A2824
MTEPADPFEPPLPRVVRKIRSELQPWVQEFIALSPFAVLSSSDGAGNHDASPRGGPPGFVRVLDPHTLLIPEEPGNRLFQTWHNLRANPGIGLLFLIPGFPETARVNGTAEVLPRGNLRWTELSTTFDNSGRLAGGLLISVTEAYYHCGRAAKFSHLWDTAAINRHLADPPLPKRPPAEKSPA